MDDSTVKQRSRKRAKRKRPSDIINDPVCQQLVEDFVQDLSDRVTKKKTNLDSVSELKARLSDNGWLPGLTDQSYEGIIRAGFRGKNLELACVATEILVEQQPSTLRGEFYQVVSAGWLPNTDKQHYARLGRVMTTLRETGVVPFTWLVDNLRETNKPSSWTGLKDFAETVRSAYRLDFWASLPECVHIFCEKDAIAGTLSPVTNEYDVALSPIRGYCSLSFAHEIADQWNRIDKPIHAYYVGDFDPSGFDLERDVKAKLTRYCDNPFEWTRLGVHASDFEEFNLIPLDAKKTDRRYQSFIDTHGERCAELDAIPPNELRRRVREAIESHIPQEEWERLKEVEKVEKESFDNFMALLSVRGA